MFFYSCLFYFLKGNFYNLLPLFIFTFLLPTSLIYIKLLFIFHSKLLSYPPFFHNSVLHNKYLYFYIFNFLSFICVFDNLKRKHMKIRLNINPPLKQEELLQLKKKKKNIGLVEKYLSGNVTIYSQMKKYNDLRQISSKFKLLSQPHLNFLTDFDDMPPNQSC